jgi:hypothetical protein
MPCFPDAYWRVVSSGGHAGGVGANVWRHQPRGYQGVQLLQAMANAVTQHANAVTHVLVVFHTLVPLDSCLMIFEGGMHHSLQVAALHMWG